MKLQLLIGSYEEPERSAARRYIRPEHAVVELGGCIGVVACITNKLLTKPAKHIVVEANPFVVPLLQANRDTNRCSFTIVNRALAYDSATVSLMPSPDFWGTTLHDSSNSRPRVDVPVTQLQTLVEDAQFDRFALICDIEGQEYVLVKNELDTLRKAEVIIMELHPHLLGEDKVNEILAQLGTIGFQLSERAGAVVVLQRT
jgi:FkbM family methyltransferase